MDQKAAKVPPPRPLDMPEPEVIEVNMTTTYATITALSVASILGSIATINLWRRVRRVEDDAEALRVLITSLVNDTECGQVAYTHVVERAEAEERGESIANVDDEFIPYPEEESTDEPRVRVRRARDIQPNI